MVTVKTPPSPDALNDISNGCSGGVTWFYKTFLGRDIGCRYCCDEHDMAYEEGGDWQDRLHADNRFFRCIWESGRQVRATLFWCAVRMGGWLFWG